MTTQAPKSALEQVLEVHAGFVNEAKRLRMQIGQGKHAQGSIEKSLAERNGFEMHRGLWIQMNPGNVLPDTVKEAFLQLDVLEAKHAQLNNTQQNV